MQDHDSLARRIGVLLAVIIPFLGVITAIVVSWEKGVDRISLSLLLIFYALTVLGVGVGFHRLFTHSSFKTYPAVKVILGFLGSMALEGSINDWVTDHRVHHQHSDREGDPHSPSWGRHGFFGALRGFLHAHTNWLFSYRVRRDYARYIPDLLKDRTVAFMSRYFALWVAIGLLVPALIAFLVSGTIKGALLGFLWGGLVRIFLVHHVTWSVNSVCHLFGSHPFRSSDKSRNNFIFGILAFGEGYHHNHHVFPRSARHGLFWWQVDISWLAIRAMERLKLAWDVSLPTREQMRAKRQPLAIL